MKYNHTTKQDEKFVIKVGDYVSFKADTEQTGKVMKIYRSEYARQDTLDIMYKSNDESEQECFTSELAKDCWIE